MQPVDPHPHYQSALTERHARKIELDTRDRWLSYARLATVAVVIAMAWGVFWRDAASGWWLLIPVSGFIALMRIHDRVIRAQEAAARAVEWYERGLARLEDRWAGAGETGARFRDDTHPYANDLDLFGDGSLFQLLDTTQTTSGKETLARWLTTPSSPSMIRSRHPAVTDLSNRRQLREDLHSLGVDARRAVDSGALIGWATAPGRLERRWLQMLPTLVSGAFLTSLVLWGVGVAPGVLPLGLVLVNVGLGLALLKTTSRILHGSSEPSRELVVLGAVLGRLREESYEADRLRSLSSTLQAERTDPVIAVRRLDWLLQMHDWQHNMLFAPIAASVGWGIQIAVAVERWRQRHGGSVEGWLATVGEFEALAALGTYHFEHPTQPFPTVLDEEGTTVPIYEAEQVAHPLLPATGAVANDVRLGPAPQLIVVSGSNMSGKTTLLRTVGVNAVLALAGAPVRADSLRLTPVALGGTLRVQDSLLEGRSRFYAEILRVKQLVEIARGPTPLLFLMDELFHGTNSHDRVEGAHGVLEHLVDLGAIGMVTTHDLALAAIGDRLGARAINVHFEDQMEAGKLSFDYRLRAGRATHGNALALMQAVGLDMESTGARY